MIDDLIRRSDAIEAIEVVDWYHQNRNKDMVSGANSDEHQAWYKADDIYEALEAVPSADRKTEPQYSEDDMYWLSLAEDVANGKMSDAGATQAWYEYINHKDEPQTEYERGYRQGKEDEINKHHVGR